MVYQTTKMKMFSDAINSLRDNKGCVSGDATFDARKTSSIYLPALSFPPYNFLLYMLNFEIP